MPPTALRPFRVSLGRTLLIYGLYVCFLGTAFSDDWKPDRVLATATISRDGSPIYIPVQIADRKVQFIVDTGSTVTCIDNLLTMGLKQRRQPVDAATTFGSVSTTAFIPPAEFAVGGVKCDWLPYICGVDLSLLSRSMDTDIGGIVGMDFLRRFITHIDFDTGRILLCDPEETSRPPGQSVPILFNDGGCPTLLAKIGTQSIPFKIDTGFTGSCAVREPVLNDLKTQGTVRPTGVHISVYSVENKPKIVEQFRCKTISIGEYNSSGIVMSPSNVNILGLSYLCRFKVTLDCVAERVYLTPGTKLLLRDRYDYDGVSVVNERNGEWVIAGIAKGSVGEAAGLRMGDRIMSLDGKDAAQCSRPQILRLLGLPRLSNIPLVIERERHRIELAIPGG